MQSAAGSGRQILDNLKRLHGTQQVDLTIMWDYPPVELRDRKGELRQLQDA